MPMTGIERRGPSMVGIARASIAARLNGAPYTPEAMGPSQAVFVTLRTRTRDALRGCVGRLAPAFADLGQEIASCAQSAAFSDPRFDPVTASELSGLRIEISLLSQPSAIAGPEQLDPARYGVVVKSGDKGAVLLPQIPGIETVAEQVSAVLRKAGIDPDAEFALSRFEVEKYVEP